MLTEVELQQFSIHENQFSRPEDGGSMQLQNFGAFNHYTV